MPIDTRQSIIARAQDTLLNTSTDLKNKMKIWINERYERIIDVAAPHMFVRQKTLTAVASTRELSIGSDVLRILTIYDTTNERNIKECSLTRIEERGLDVSDDTGDPNEYARLGEFSVSAELGSASTIQVTSSSASDITPHILRVTGLSSGIEISDDIIITGTSAATGAVTFDANQKLKLAVGTNNGSTKSMVGTLTVTDGSNTLSTIPKNLVAPEFVWISWKPVPDSDASQPSYRMTYLKRPLPFDDDNDTPEFDCTQALVVGLIADGLLEDGQDQEGLIWEDKFSARVGEIISNYNNNPNYIEQFSPDPAGFPLGNAESRIGGVYTNPWSW